MPSIAMRASAFRGRRRRLTGRTAMMDRLTDTLNFQAQALTLRSERQRLIASNIANADTPGYVAREMDFAAALREATGAATPGKQMLATRPGHIAPAAGAVSEAGLKYATPSQTNLDRNTVDMDRERAAFADNAVHYEATLRFINGSVRTMLSAITGQ
jgi:flagellar basal-body rod protein FlgB